MGRKRVKKEVIEENNEEEVEGRQPLVANKIKLKSSAKFKCNECNDVLNTEDEANKHIFKEHYGLARINDESKTPFTENEIIKALIKAQKTFKTLKCKNNGCDKTFKSGLGLKMHWDLCGKSENEVSAVCQVCGKRLKKASLPIHMKIHEKKAPTPRKTPEKQINSDCSGKRASALKAKQTIRKTTRGEVIISGNISDEEFNADSDETEEEENISETETQMIVSESSNLKNGKNVEQNFKSVLKLWAEFIVSVKDFLREVPKNCYDLWSKEITAKGKVKCPLEDCSQVFTTKDGLKYHYKRCGIDFKFMWKCKVCGFEALKGNRIIVQHLWSTHRDLLPKISQELAECIETANVTTAHNKIKDLTSCASNTSFTNISCYQEFHKRFFNRKSFPNLMPNIHSWIALNEEEFNIYIPSEYIDGKGFNGNPSVNFRSTLSSDNSWIRLKMFESNASEQSLNFFVGGPVWAMGWLPLPLNSDNCTQYLAVASNMNPEISHTLNDTDIESGLIQIWSVGKLGLKFDSSIKPMMAFSIAHFCGMVWDMEWCPGGTTWDDISSVDERYPEALPRLGLLGIACGDGFIRIHSIPHPESLPNSYNNSLYYNEPVVILNPPGVGNSVNCENTICKCLSWIRSNEQHLIVGGYGSGIIAVWDLNTKSSLLIVEQNPNQMILRPLKSWIGHSAAVNRLKWVHNSSDQFVVSCSFDRSAKLWDLRDLSLPITVYKRGLFTSVDTHHQWNGMFLAGDDCYQGFINNTVFKDFGFFNFGALSLSCHKSCVWDLSVSEWTSATACADASGEAVLYPFFQFKADPKRKPFDRMPLYHIIPVLLDDNSIQTTDPKTKKQKKSSSITTVDQTKPPSRSYSEISSKYGLVFYDYDMSELKAVPQKEIDRIRLPTHMQYQRINDYPLISINRVCWNPNLTSYAWILSATQSGLCRLSCVSFLGST